MKRRLILWILFIAMVPLLSGCGGGGAEVRSEVTSVTTGQQLMDLKKALDMGAMTRDEYDREREKILNKD
ncbi:MAG: gas vesicle protein GvpG [Proteobacteria bacterium]|nr:gas vesicle protein GvpG [Pseudomonadota bacterium]MBU1650003.1 gas vesicle protein GvpG [Pseudomonadota bacterium]MBU1986084.1 gas vesicle protein GvpG [Pseudomonadota bacterium]